MIKFSMAGDPIDNVLFYIPALDSDALAHISIEYLTINGVTYRFPYCSEYIEEDSSIPSIIKFSDYIYSFNTEEAPVIILIDEETKIVYSFPIYWSYIIDIQLDYIKYFVRTNYREIDFNLNNLSIVSKWSYPTQTTTGYNLAPVYNTWFYFNSNDTSYFIIKNNDKYIKFDVQAPYIPYDTTFFSKNFGENIIPVNSYSFNLIDKLNNKYITYNFYTDFRGNGYNYVIYPLDKDMQLFVVVKEPDYETNMYGSLTFMKLNPDYSINVYESDIPILDTGYFINYYTDRYILNITRNNNIISLDSSNGIDSILGSLSSSFNIDWNNPTHIIQPTNIYSGYETDIDVGEFTFETNNSYESTIVDVKDHSRWEDVTSYLTNDDFRLYELEQTDYISFFNIGTEDNPKYNINFVNLSDDTNKIIQRYVTTTNKQIIHTASIDKNPSKKYILANIDGEDRYYDKPTIQDWMDTVGVPDRPINLKTILLPIDFDGDIDDILAKYFKNVKYHGLRMGWTAPNLIDPSKIPGSLYRWYDEYPYRHYLYTTPDGYHQYDLWIEFNTDDINEWYNFDTIRLDYVHRCLNDDRFDKSIFDIAYINISAIDSSLVYTLDEYITENPILNYEFDYEDLGAFNLEDEYRVPPLKTLYDKYVRLDELFDAVETLGYKNIKNRLYLLRPKYIRRYLFAYKDINSISSVTDITPKDAGISESFIENTLIDNIEDFNIISKDYGYNRYASTSITPFGFKNAYYDGKYIYVYFVYQYDTINGYQRYIKYTLEPKNPNNQYIMLYSLTQDYIDYYRTNNKYPTILAKDYYFVATPYSQLLNNSSTTDSPSLHGYIIDDTLLYQSNDYITDIDTIRYLLTQNKNSYNKLGLIVTPPTEDSCNTLKDIIEKHESVDKVVLSFPQNIISIDGDENIFNIPIDVLHIQPEVYEIDISQSSQFTLPYSGSSSSYTISDNKIVIDLSKTNIMPDQIKNANISIKLNSFVESPDKIEFLDKEVSYSNKQSISDTELEIDFNYGDINTDSFTTNSNISLLYTTYISDIPVEVKKDVVRVFNTNMYDGMYTQQMYYNDDTLSFACGYMSQYYQGPGYITYITDFSLARYGMNIEGDVNYVISLSNYTEDDTIILDYSDILIPKEKSYAAYNVVDITNYPTTTKNIIFLYDISDVPNISTTNTLNSEIQIRIEDGYRYRINAYDIYNSQYVMFITLPYISGGNEIFFADIVNKQKIVSYSNVDSRSAFCKEDNILYMFDNTNKRLLKIDITTGDIILKKDINTNTILTASPTFEGFGAWIQKYIAYSNISINNDYLYLSFTYIDNTSYVVILDKDFNLIESHKIGGSYKSLTVRNTDQPIFLMDIDNTGKYNYVYYYDTNELIKLPDNVINYTVNATSKYIVFNTDWRSNVVVSLDNRKLDTNGSDTYTVKLPNGSDITVQFNVQIPIEIDNQVFTVTDSTYEYTTTDTQLFFTINTTEIDPYYVSIEPEADEGSTGTLVSTTDSYTTNPTDEDQIGTEVTNTELYTTSESDVDTTSTTSLTDVFSTNQ